MSRGIFIALILRISIFAVAGLASLMMPPSTHPPGEWGSFVFLTGLAAVQVAILHWGLLRPNATTFREIGWRGFRGLDVPLGILTGLACLVAMLGTFALLGGLELGPYLTHVLERDPGASALYLATGLFAAFTEETVYRGWLQPAFVERWGRWLGLLAAAAIFALFHFQRPLALLAKLGVGLLLGLVRERTRTLWAPGIAHALIWVALGDS